MIRIPTILHGCILFLASIMDSAAQQPLLTEIASLRADQQLLWQRVSPTAQQPNGPVLYQIIFRSSATPGAIPKISPSFTLTNSLIGEDGIGVHVGSLTIAPSGSISLCCGQSFGLSAISHDTTLVGDGNGTPLGVAAPLILSTTGVYALQAHSLSTEPTAYGLSGDANNSSGGIGVAGSARGNLSTGVFGTSSGTTGVGVEGNGTFGVYGVGTQTGVLATNQNNPAVSASLATGCCAGRFVGDVQVQGTLTKSGGSFKIDHPLDPANKYLYHSFVESPDMMNIYNGIVALDANGEAEVTLPEWFGALNRDFRYQLTSIGAPGPNLYVAKEIADNRFKIAGGPPGGRVSWQVTGIRQDAYANAHRIPVEQDKPGAEKGTYLHPELFGAFPEKGIGALHGPKAALRNRP